MTAAKKAAETLYIARQRATCQRAGKTAINIPSIRQAARDYGVSHTAIQKHLRALQEGHDLRVSPDEPGRPRSFTEAEDVALGVAM
ncbi:uncharacterized protein LY79DRAFT_565743 [Colletotrichum navitas]|uniref:HTH psq-type domain-containing protein n=1 Tax=Colletotrichum navitas TaxID=681940 RepID=A0AAD8UZ35_9PEZI|nr:uncharacterized protein LY79DRAFT_565743 [Colletotrichum navitas]KAK1574496.1 hypothetical protein LY79DRAFT_565743 [Colletotrichum navitas]